MTAVTALHDVTSRIQARAHAVGRDPLSATLIAVSKTVAPEHILPVIKAGHRHFGENRIQEAAIKWPTLRQKADDIVLHMIGPLQTNKAREAVALFDMIHTVDRPRLAEKLSQEMDLQDRRPPCLVQVNTGREPQKAGIDPEDADDFISKCRKQWNLPVEGLMCIPPAQEEPSPHFAFLREVARRNELNHLSMGMSSDYEVAVDFGATFLRVGTAIFGPRESAPK